jgi:hypothetical protein
MMSSGLKEGMKGNLQFSFNETFNVLFTQPINCCIKYSFNIFDEKTPNVYLQYIHEI